MIYTVLWRPLAEQQLAQLWLDAADRDATASAADFIDKTLRRDPEEKGESRADNSRVLFVPPLVVLFKVEDEDRIVHVTGVARTRRKV
jgi:mRNA-degrading endonuclease RelE of RelBE toxin-antitoxin system